MTPLTTTETEYIPIPTSLYPTCNKPQFNGKTIGDRLIWSEKLNKDYSKCIQDVDTLIKFIDSQKENDDG